ncbi:MAG TPA: lipase secretion chaperone [Gammaproteobacteria bacterium]|nr:lipase secretion chaperone [Gammaproteobacteria bacterium]
MGLLLIASAGRERSQPEPRPVAVAAPAVAERAAVIGTTSATPGGQQPLPPHDGTAIDGGVLLDAAGNVVPASGLRRLFEYFLTGLGRDDITGLRARLALALREREMAAAAVAQTLALFDRYVEYRRVLSDLPTPPTGLLASDPESLRAAFEERYALRRQILGAELADAFFARDEAEDRFVMESLALSKRQDLPEWQRQQQLALLEQQLPDDIRAAREQSRTAIVLQERTEQLRQANASEAEILRMREELLGPVAAGRLATLDQARSQWQQRLDAYRRERDHIVTAAGLSEADKQAAVDALIEQRFNAQEARRVRALDRMDQGS